MGLIWVLQSSKLAISVARFKTDCHYIGCCDALTREEMHQNHVFTTEWREGETLTVRHVQRLYNRLFENAFLVAENDIEETTIKMAFEYAKKQKSITVLFDTKGDVSQSLLSVSDLVVTNKKYDFKGKTIELKCDNDKILHSAGAIMLCLMNTENSSQNPISQHEHLIKAAISCVAPPWYDEIAYTV